MFWILIGITIGIIGAVSGWFLGTRPNRTGKSNQLEATISWATRLIESLLKDKVDQDSIDYAFLETVLNLANCRAVLLLEAEDTSGVVYKSSTGLPARAKVVSSLISAPECVESPDNWRHSLLEWIWHQEQQSNERESCWIPEYRIISSDTIIVKLDNSAIIGVNSV